ncbi:hypothetical protein BRC90_11865 [Halobacteriales archaeon QS_4_69_34]|nr:MAG: hypothetical protein BRC90_11865 [Halobacteriales archaeon QS_4_69_34]
MYTGKTEQPCCLCGDPESVARLDLPPRTIQLLRHSGSIAWRDVVGELSIHFCASGWTLVTELALDAGMHPLSRCNAARASFDVREDFEALLADVREEPDQTAMERRMLAASRRVVECYGEDELIEERDLVEARVIELALSELGVAATTA